MSADGAFGVESSPLTGSRGSSDASASRDAQNLLSTRLVRELIAADARSDRDSDDPERAAQALLQVAVSGLRLSAGAVVRFDAETSHACCVAAHAVDDRVRAALEQGEDAPGGPSLAIRALTSHRVLLLERASREPLMAALVAASRDVGTAAIVPLYDRGTPVAALLLAERAAQALTASSIRLLAAAFHLFGVLLSPGRGTAMAQRQAETAAAERERYLLEIEELHHRLEEAHEAARQASSEIQNAETAQRAEVERFRGRVAELEAVAQRSEIEAMLRRELEDSCAIANRQVAERERRIAELEEDGRRLRSRLEELERAAERQRQEAEAAARAPRPGIAEVAVPRIVEEAEAVELGEMAAAAVAAMGGDAAPAPAPAQLGEEFATADAGDGEMVNEVVLDDAFSGGVSSVAEAVALAAADEERTDEDAPEEIPEIAVADVARALVCLDSDEVIREVARQAADNVGAAFWCGEGDLPNASRTVIAVNLFAPELQRTVELIAASNGDVDCSAYGFDPGESSGFELGDVGWIHRPIDPNEALARVQNEVPGKLGVVVVVSSQLRELAGLREVLAARGASSSVACDSRQALDLLDIVRKPDAMLVDLGIDGGQGLTLAAQLRSQPQTRDIPLLLLLPAELDPARMRAAAGRSGILAPYGGHEIGRMLTAALSAR
jgi:CheY-like chemotaxis protein